MQQIAGAGQAPHPNVPNNTSHLGIRIAKIAVVVFSCSLLLAAAGTAFYFAAPLFVAGGFAIAGGVALCGAGVGSLVGIGGSLAYKDFSNPMFNVTDSNLKDSLQFFGITMGSGAVFAAGFALVPVIISLIVLTVAFLGHMAMIGAPVLL